MPEIPTASLNLLPDGNSTGMHPPTLKAMVGKIQAERTAGTVSDTTPPLKHPDKPPQIP